MSVLTKNDVINLFLTCISVALSTQYVVGVGFANSVVTDKRFI